MLNTCKHRRVSLNFCTAAADIIIMFRHQSGELNEATVCPSVRFSVCLSLAQKVVLFGAIVTIEH